MEFGNIFRLVFLENIFIAVFLELEGGIVGLIEVVVRERFGDFIKCYCVKFCLMFYSFIGVEEKVMVKLVVEINIDRVLGVYMVGKDVGEII